MTTTECTILKSPFPYFGGKKTVAAEIWERFGRTDRYIEPFFGSGAVLLANPYWENCCEIVNDLDHYIANAWRAIKHAPDEVARWADCPIVEADLHARHIWLVNEGRKRIMRCAADPVFYDANKLPQPGKSACYFCPAMKRSEVVRLKAEHPELLARALEIERRSQKTNRTNRGLGGEKNKWADWLAICERKKATSAT